MFEGFDEFFALNWKGVEGWGVVYLSEALRMVKGFMGLVEALVLRLPLWLCFFKFCVMDFKLFVGFVGSGLWWCKGKQ